MKGNKLQWRCLEEIALAQDYLTVLQHVKELVQKRSDYPNIEISNELDMAIKTLKKYVKKLDPSG